LLGPALLIHAESGGATRQRKAIEAGLDHRESRAVGDVGEAECDEGGRLTRIVHGRLDRVGMPAVREQMLGLHLLDGDLHIPHRAMKCNLTIA